MRPRAPARLTVLGGVVGASERTVLTYARWLANHERSHDRQIARIVDVVRGAGS